MNDYKVKISIRDTAYEVDIFDFLCILNDAVDMTLLSKQDGSKSDREARKKRRLLALNMYADLNKYNIEKQLHEMEGER